MTAVLREMTTNREDAKKSGGHHHSNLMKKLRKKVHAPLHLDQTPSPRLSPSSTEEQGGIASSSYRSSSQSCNHKVGNNSSQRCDSLPPVSSFIAEQRGPAMMKSTTDKDLQNVRRMMATLDGFSVSHSGEQGGAVFSSNRITSGSGQSNDRRFGNNSSHRCGSLPPVSSFISEQRGPAMMKSSTDNELQSVRRMMATLDGLV